MLAATLAILTMLIPGITDAPTYAVYGDSNTTGHKGNLVAGIDAGVAYPVATSTAGPGLVGGVAFDGFTSVGIANRTVPVEADRIVIMLGTNDIEPENQKWTPDHRSTTFNALQSIRKKAGKTAAQTVVVAIPPNNRQPETAKAFNAWLRGFQTNYGWTFIDPWSDMRASSGRWLIAKQYLTPDGIHATPEGYAIVGARIAEALR